MSPSQLALDVSQPHHTYGLIVFVGLLVCAAVAYLLLR